MFFSRQFKEITLYYIKNKMAFAFVNIFESSIASKIHDYARLPEEITVRVIYQNHPLAQEEIYTVTLPRDACAADLQRYMAEVPMFKQHRWKPCEMDFYVGTSVADPWRVPVAHYHVHAAGPSERAPALALYVKN